MYIGNPSQCFFNIYRKTRICRRLGAACIVIICFLLLKCHTKGYFSKKKAFLDMRLYKTPLQKRRQIVFIVISLLT